MLRQRVERLFPKGAVVREPPLGFGKWPGLEGTPVDATIHSAPHEAGALEHPKVLRDGREGHLEGIGEVGDRRGRFAESREDRSPRAIGQRAKHPVEAFVSGYPRGGS